MIIEEKVSGDRTTFKEILCGNAFEYCQCKFIKTERPGEAVDLCTGEVVDFYDHYIVNEINAKVVIK